MRLPDSGGVRQCGRKVGQGWPVGGELGSLGCFGGRKGQPNTQGPGLGLRREKANVDEMMNGNNEAAAATKGEEVGRARGAHLSAPTVR